MKAIATYQSVRDRDRLIVAMHETHGRDSRYSLLYLAGTPNKQRHEPNHRVRIVAAQLELFELTACGVLIFCYACVPLSD